MRWFLWLVYRNRRDVGLAVLTLIVLPAVAQCLAGVFR